MRNKNRRPELVTYRERRERRWMMLNHMHRKAAIEASREIR